MLNIDKQIFTSNLNLTQEYCRLQMDKKQNDNAKMFRSYNPVVNNKPLFSFEVEPFHFDSDPNLNSNTFAKWSIDPTTSAHKNLIHLLFEQQINFKQEQVILNKEQAYEGDILVSQADNTVIDSASEVQSLGLIDVYDLPPIDTWFYLTSNSESRLLFAWIPKDLRFYANEAIWVNCVDCIDWFNQCYPEDFKEIVTN